jgi:hypothetical protein
MTISDMTPAFPQFPAPPFSGSVPDTKEAAALGLCREPLVFCRTF